MIYELSPGVGGWTETILYNFKGGANDGASPHATLTADAAGNLYGTTVAGGPHTSACGEGCGTVFMLSPAPGGYEETVLFRFNGADGAVPYAGVTLDSAGNLYGATISGGSFNAGVVYKLAATSGTWQQTLLYTFEGRPDGAAPYGTPILDATGNLYGTTEAGGARNVGIVYMLAPQADGSWTEQTLHTFAGGADGASPLIAGIIFDPQGNLYGTTTLGGTANCGTAFKLVRKISGGWTERILHNFLGVSSQDGENPNGVVFGPGGDLYGTTTGGGLYNPGTIFKMTREPNGAWIEKVLYSFTAGDDGAYPAAGVVLDPAGNIYGTTLWGGPSGDTTGGVAFEFMR